MPPAFIEQVIIQRNCTLCTYNKYCVSIDGHEPLCATSLMFKSNGQLDTNSVSVYSDNGNFMLLLIFILLHCINILLLGVTKEHLTKLVRQCQHNQQKTLL